MPDDSYFCEKENSKLLKSAKSFKNSVWLAGNGT